jgi:two-component system, chemotaxis family, sensor kinase CheA
MNRIVDTAVKVLNSAAATLPLAERTEKVPLATAMSELEKLHGIEGLPPAFKTIVKRVIKLIELIILDTTPFDSGMKQLSKGIARMEHALESMTDAVSDEVTGNSVVADTSESQDTAETDTIKKSPSAEDTPVAADMADLVEKFAQQLSITLEDFETYVLEAEKGVDQAYIEMKRVLHTWKGEFGVLDMRQYVGIIHSLEERIEQKNVTTDQLLQFKDMLSKCAARLLKGFIPPVSDEIKKLILGSDVPEKTSEEPSEEKDEEAAQTKAEIEETALNADPGLLADFVTEAHDHIHRAETLLLKLEVDPKNMEHINTIFRACHTIKGVASFLSLENLTNVAHATENLMDKVRKGKIELTSVRIDLLFEAMDCLKEMIAAVAAALAGAPYEIPCTCSEMINRLNSSDIKDTGPVVAPIDDTGKRVGELLVERGATSQHQIEKALNKQDKGDGRPLGEILIDEKVPARMVGKALATQSMNKMATGGAVEDTIRVPVKRLDQLIDAIGEGVIAQSMVYANSAVAGLKDLALEKKIAQSMLIMRQIQEMSMSLRMVTLRSTFQKMARLVRDLSKKVGKDVEFVMEGEDTELDKSVVENIGDPLIHMLRNSLDHGIESREERLQSGKTEKARIVLRAYHKAGNVCIEIEDDGRGLDRENIFRKAVDRGLCKADDTPMDQEIFQYIFMPGFSTAAQVTDISGRGVGMDVVQRNITVLRGAIDIQSEKGKGTLFTIRLPLTLAIINGMIVRLSNERYIVPTLSILESILPRKNQIESVVGKGEVLKVRGELVRLIRLESLFFGGQNGGLKKTHDGIALVVEDAMGRKVALFVNEIIDQQQVVIKNLGEGLGEIPGVAGGAIMSDGTISLILDVAGIVKIAAE